MSHLEKRKFILKSLFDMSNCKDSSQVNNISEVKQIPSTGNYKSGKEIVVESFRPIELKMEDITTIEGSKATSQEPEDSGDWKYCETLPTTWTANSRLPEMNIPMLQPSAHSYSSEYKRKNLYSLSDSSRRICWLSCLAESTEHPQIETTVSKNDNLLHDVREYLASYQETYGTPRSEYSFAALVRVMGQATGRSLLALFYIIINVAPVAEIFLHILRFILDRTISILNTSDRRQILIKYFVLGVQLLSVYICLVFIFGSIVVPIVQIVFGILTKIMLYG